jgi:hypothetical protein
MLLARAIGEVARSHKQLKAKRRSKLGLNGNPLHSLRRKNSNGGNGLEVNPAIKEAIAHEVYQALHDTMPGMLAEAVKAMGGKNDEVNKKKTPNLEMEVITESEEGNDTEESEEDTKKGCNYGAFKRCSPLHSMTLRMLQPRNSGLGR